MIRSLYCFSAFCAFVEAVRLRLVPWFSAYAGLSVLVLASRFTPESIAYTRHLWAPLEGLRVLALCGATIEAYQDHNEERSRFAIAVFLLAAMCAGGLPFTFESDPRWLTAFIQIRVYIRALASCFLLVDLLLILYQRWWIPGAEFRHLLCFSGICWMNTLADLGYLLNGKWRIDWKVWGGIDSFTLAGSALCYLLWIFWRERPRLLRSRPRSRATDALSVESCDDPRASARASRQSYR